MARNKNFTSIVSTKQISKVVDDMLERYKTQRMPFERRWYDNNFFDDGYHFRFMSAKTGKIVDLSSQVYEKSPRRSIPKASRQIRGVASLLLQLEPRPAIYPERVSSSSFMDDGEVNQDAYKRALDVAKQTAKRTGHWTQEEWDDQDMDEKLTHMIILAAKHGISFIEIWPDAVSEKTESKVFDAFDIFLDGTSTSIYDSPTITKAVPTLISKIKANETFDEVQRLKISPDNRYASSEIKQAYMQSRFGSGMEKENQATAILRETFIKEYLNDENVKRIKKQEDSDLILSGKSKGDEVVRQIFDTSNGWLSDEYTNLVEYPYVDYRFEPGLVYQVPLIERFIPANKSLDIAVSRVEGYANTMVTGIYQKRKGENFQIANIPGGQVIEYEGTPLTQMNIASVPGFMFQFINLLEQIIEEQGASTSTLGKLPSGVKSGVAIESIKATEFANLKIPAKMFNKTVKRIAQRMIEYAADNLIDPQEVVILDDAEPDYFDVIGERGLKEREKLGLKVPDGTIVIKKGTKVRIEIENGLGYTVEGKKETMQQIANYMLQLAEVGMVNKEQVQVLLKRFLQIFQFGSTAEFMDAMDAEGEDMTEDDLNKIKIAMLEVMKDTGAVGEEAEQRSIDTTKVGVIESLKDIAGE